MKRYRLLFSVLANTPLIALLQTPAIGAPPPNVCQSALLPVFNILTMPGKEKFVDGRPAFSPDGETVLFMRGPVPTGEPSSLYTINLSGGRLKKSSRSVVLKFIRSPGLTGLGIGNRSQLHFPGNQAFTCSI